MLPYFIVFINITIFGLIVDLSKHRVVKFIFSIFILFSFVSLYYYREYSIGADTLNYITIFQNIFEVDNVFDYSIDSNIEIGFSFIVYFLGLFNEDPFFIFAALTTLIYINLIYSIFRYKLSFTLFFSSLFCIFQIYFYSFNLLRQMLAISFLILAVSFLLDNKNKRFFVYSFLAFIFHYSSIFIFLFYYLYKFRYIIVRFWYITVFGAFLSLAILFRLVVGNFDKYSAYNSGDVITDSGGVLLNLFYFSVFFLAVFLKKYISNMRSEFYFFLTVYGFYISLSLYFFTASFLNQGIIRIALYFLWSSVFIILILIKNISDIYARTIVCFLYYIFLLCFTFYFLSNAGYDLMPYRFR